MTSKIVPIDILGATHKVDKTLRRHRWCGTGNFEQSRLALENFIPLFTPPTFGKHAARTSVAMAAATGAAAEVPEKVRNPLTHHNKGGGRFSDWCNTIWFRMKRSMLQQIIRFVHLVDGVPDKRIKSESYKKRAWGRRRRTTNRPQERSIAYVRGHSLLFCIEVSRSSTHHELTLRDHQQHKLWASLWSLVQPRRVLETRMN